MHQRLSLLAQKGFSPSVVYDIGAYQGWWSLSLCLLFPASQYFLFEANEDNRPFLAALPFPFFLSLLGDREGPAPFYCSKTPCNSGESLFVEETPHYAPERLQPRTLQMTTLTALAQEHSLPPPDLIKMDVQGAELLILRGSPAWISHAEAVILELKVLAYNRGAPLFAEVIAQMDQMGYVLNDLLASHYLPTGELNEVDALFLKKGSPLIKTGPLA